ncbi:MAG: alpha/beta hydrolase [Lapillicoccus sp.]
MFELDLRDGGRLIGQTWGEGPGVVVVQRSLSVWGHYDELAERLAAHYTVHVYDRRGHGDSSARGPYSTLRREVQDLAAVLDETGSDSVFAHSSGALVALELARGRSLRGLALYDPGVSLDGSVPDEWVPDLLEALKSDDDGAAMAVVAAGFGRPAWLSALPRGVREALVRSFLRSRRGRVYQRQLGTGTAELLQVVAHDRGPHAYAGIRSPLWLGVGEASPRHYLETAELLHAAVSDSRLQRVAGAEHSETGMPLAVVESLVSFFDECLTAPDGRQV